MKRELEGCKFSKKALQESNNKQQTEIDSMNSHVRLMTAQNEELAREIDQFVYQNEQIRD